MKLTSDCEEILVPIRIAWRFSTAEQQHPVTDSMLVPSFKVCFQLVELPYWLESFADDDFFLMMQNSCEVSPYEYNTA